MCQTRYNYERAFTSFCAEKQSKIAKEIGNTLRNKDPRFWFPSINKIIELQNGNSELDKFAGLIEYLRTPKMTGYECISVVYLLNKISIILDSCKITPPWLEKSTGYHRKYIAPHIWPSRHIRKLKEGLIKTQGIGITKSYQPAVKNENWMIPSQRPCTVHRPIFRNIQETLKMQLEQGIPWGVVYLDQLV